MFKTVGDDKEAGDTHKDVEHKAPADASEGAEKEGTPNKDFPQRKQFTKKFLHIYKFYCI